MRFWFQPKHPRNLFIHSYLFFFNLRGENPPQKNQTCLKMPLNLRAETEGRTAAQPRGSRRAAGCQGWLTLGTRSPSPTLLSCLSGERLSAFDSTVKLLIWRHESAGSLSALHITFRYSLIKLRWRRARGGSVSDKRVSSSRQWPFPFVPSNPQRAKKEKKKKKLLQEHVSAAKQADEAL